MIAASPVSRRPKSLLDMPPELLALILQACSFDSLAKLALLSMRTRALVFHHYRADLFNRLSPFVDNIQALFTVLRRTGSILYGSFVTAYLLRDREWRCYSLGIMVSDDPQSLATIATYLSETGYVPEDLVRSAYELYAGGPPSGRQRRYHFVSRFTGDRIHVFVSNTCSPLLTIARSWSSLGFAYIAPDFIFCAYPQLTPRRIAFLSPAVSAKPRFVYNYSKWLERNITISAIDSASNAVIPTGRRFLDGGERSHDDGGCLWLPLELEESSRDVPSATDRLRVTLPFRVLRWRWPKMSSVLAGSVDAVVER